MQNERLPLRATPADVLAKLAGILEGTVFVMVPVAINIAIAVGLIVLLCGCVRFVRWCL